MSSVSIKLYGVGAELALGNYLPQDTLIFNDWQEFYHYNDLIHSAHLLAEHVSNIEVKVDNKLLFSGQIPTATFKKQKSFSPVLVDRALYLRTECVEECECLCEFEVAEFDVEKLSFETQDYDLLFKVGTVFITKILYDNNELNFEWKSLKPYGNICLLCKADGGYLIPVYDAVKKVKAN